MLRNWTTAIAFSLGTLFAIGQVDAATVHSENTDGDLNGSQTFVLTSGTSTILGSSQWINANFDLDSFNFTVQAGYKLTGLVYTALSSSLAGNTIFVGGHFAIIDTASNINISGNKRVGTMDTVGFEFLSTALGAGTYLFDNYQMVRSGNTGGSWTYKIDMQVSSIAPVPLPATALLLPIGLLGLGIVRRRRKRAT
ncbi:hypothetical protein [Tateyamaria sp.]|uniref:hypothetical protein n=1 Tax=Tateyamaria sp. TaxID=1929288 RepID=UPI00329B334C